MEPNRTGHAPSTTSDHPDAPTTEQVNAAVTSFTLLADPTRVRMLWALREQDLDVATLARIADCRPTVASQHLSKLRFAGLVEATRDGGGCSIESVADMYAAFWPRPCSTPITRSQANPLTTRGAETTSPSHTGVRRHDRPLPNWLSWQSDSPVDCDGDDLHHDQRERHNQVPA